MKISLSATILFFLIFTGLTAQAQQVSVNAADYTPGFSPGALASAFGENLSSSTEASTKLPLPTELGGTRVLVNGVAAPLLYVSPFQINYQLPEKTSVGEVEVVIERNTGAKFRETIKVKNSAFSAFSFDATGSGAGAILDGRTFKQGPHEVLTTNGEPTILALFGTGLGELSSRDLASNRIHVFVGGIEAKVHYAGPQNYFAGLDQINFELPPNVADHGTLPIIVKIDNTSTNSVTVDLMSKDTTSLSVAVNESFTESSEIAALRVSPFPDIDSLKVTIRLINLVTDKNVEVAILSAPLSVDLLSSESFAKLIKRLNVKAGTYVSITGEVSDVAASFKGTAVAMKLANKNFTQKLKAPLTLTKDSPVGVSLAFDLMASVKKQADGSYVFDPMLLLNQILPIAPPTPLQKFDGKIVSLDAATKQLKVQKGEGSAASTIIVDAAKARIVAADGKGADFSALKVDQKVAVTGHLNSAGTVEALSILIGGAPPPPARPVTAIGTINSVNVAGKSFELNVTQLIGVNTLVAVKKITVKWDDKTKFVDDLSGSITADKLLVGQNAAATLTALAEPALALLVAISHPHANGLVTNIGGLPNSFVIDKYIDPRSTIIASPKIIIKLSATTKIRNAFGAQLKPTDITVGAQIDAVGNMAPGGSEMNAEFVVVFGKEIKGLTSEVSASAKTFVVTDDKGVKTKVSVGERTTILIGAGPTSLPFGFTKPDEFIKLLANKSYTVTVFGMMNASGTLEAFSLNANEKK